MQLPLSNPAPRRPTAVGSAYSGDRARWAPAAPAPPPPMPVPRLSGSSAGTGSVQWGGGIGSAPRGDRGLAAGWPPRAHPDASVRSISAEQQKWQQQRGPSEMSSHSRAGHGTPVAQPWSGNLRLPAPSSNPASARGWKFPACLAGQGQMEHEPDGRSAESSPRTPRAPAAADVTAATVGPVHPTDTATVNACPPADVRWEPDRGALYESPPPANRTGTLTTPGGQTVQSVEQLQSVSGCSFSSSMSVESLGHVAAPQGDDSGQVEFLGFGSHTNPLASGASVAESTPQSRRAPQPSTAAPGGRAGKDAAKEVSVYPASRKVAAVPPPQLATPPAAAPQPPAGRSASSRPPTSARAPAAPPPPAAAPSLPPAPARSARPGALRAPAAAAASPGDSAPYGGEQSGMESNRSEASERRSLGLSTRIVDPRSGATRRPGDQSSFELSSVLSASGVANTGDGAAGSGVVLIVNWITRTERPQGLDKAIGLVRGVLAIAVAAFALWAAGEAHWGSGSKTGLSAALLGLCCLLLVDAAGSILRATGQYAEGADPVRQSDPEDDSKKSRARRSSGANPTARATEVYHMTSRRSQGGEGLTLSPVAASASQGRDGGNGERRDPTALAAASLGWAQEAITRAARNGGKRGRSR
eukprot:TRINITY_DN297_c2_g3_i1.p1 TRINITY_DN297_c2_g3~~TRINITY_DN297_c2_g3_i1.p1  ORF type:complete len:644 (+),score=76.57 TRINITY_DN297_c2_g3_i1:176-2107(+)